MKNKSTSFTATKNVLKTSQEKQDRHLPAHAHSTILKLTFFNQEPMGEAVERLEEIHHNHGNTFMIVQCFSPIF